jgi:hypothetical protein
MNTGRSLSSFASLVIDYARSKAPRDMRTMVVVSPPFRKRVRRPMYVSFLFMFAVVCQSVSSEDV